MVILDEEAANERSPLKTSNAPLPPQPQGPAPPSYTASTSVPSPLPPGGYVHGYQPVPHHQQHHQQHHHQHQHHHHQEHHESPALLIRRDTPGQRFLKAFLCALFVLFLWSLFVNTLSLSLHPPKRGPYSKKYPYSERLQKIVATAGLCPCATPDLPRALPISYPPVGHVRIQSHIVPTNTAPCATATPQ